MAIKAADQITIVDVTDAYAVHLSKDSYVFEGTTSAAIAGSVSFRVSALRGSETISASVNSSEITCPNGVTASVDQTGDNAGSPLITVSVTTAVTQPGVVSIPVVVDDVTIIKDFSYGISFKGATGAPGTNATDPYNYLIGNDSGVISCTDTGAVSGAQTIVIPFSGWQGVTRKAATIGLKSGSSLPSGMSIASGANVAATTSQDGSLTISVANASTLGGASNGTISLEITVDGKRTAKFTHILSLSRVQTAPTVLTEQMALTEKTQYHLVNLQAAKRLGQFPVQVTVLSKHLPQLLLNGEDIKV